MHFYGSVSQYLSFFLLGLTFCRHISLTFGKSAIISNSFCKDIPLPFPEDDQYIHTFLEKALELYGKPIVGQMVEDIDKFHFDQSTNHDDEATDSAIIKWFQQLLDYSDISPPDLISNPIYHRLRTVLNTRYMHFPET